MPAKWRAEADELTRGMRKRKVLDVKLSPVEQVLVGVTPAEPSRAGETEDGLELGELVAVAGLLWAIFGR